jgi:hypothetical protein
MENEKFTLLIGTMISLCLASILSLIPVWQLIFIAGIAGGIINKKPRFGALSGALGVGLFWILYMIDGVFIKELYGLFDLIGELIIGSSGIGWLLLLIIIIMGFLFGLLGGVLGSSGTNLVLYFYTTHKSSGRKVENSIKSSKS